MGLCPYTFIRDLLGTTPNKGPYAQHLRVVVRRAGEVKVDVALPANSARWLIDLIPEDVLFQIKKEGIPIQLIQDDLARKKDLYPAKIFHLIEVDRQVEVWLE